MIYAILSLAVVSGWSLAYYHAKEHAKVKADFREAFRAQIAAEMERDIKAARVERGEAVIALLHSEIRRLEDDLSLCVDPAVIRHRFDSLFGAAKAARPGGGKA